MSNTIKRIKKLSMYAWIGEDENGSGELGIKQALVPAGMIPIAGIHLNKIEQQFIKEAMDNQGKTYGKKICLCKFQFEKILCEVGAE